MASDRVLWAAREWGRPRAGGRSGREGEGEVGWRRERRVRREDGWGGVGRSRDREKGRGEGRRKRGEEEVE